MLFAFTCYIRIVRKYKRTYLLRKYNNDNDNDNKNGYDNDNDNNNDNNNNSIYLNTIKNSTADVVVYLK